MDKTKTKSIFILLAGMMLIICIVGGLSVYTANDILERAAADKLELRSETSVQKIDIAIRNVQRSVNILRQGIQEEKIDLKRFKEEPGYEAAFTSQLKSNLKMISESTGGCLASYVRYNPTLSGSSSGLFYVFDNQKQHFNFFTPTDFSLYKPTDIEHVGWYYIPVNHRGPVWLLPYQNENIKAYMISYVIPIFIGRVNFGVVGMDIDFDYIQKVVRDISIYDTGYAFLTYENKLIYHKDYPIYTPVETCLDEEAEVLRNAIVWDSTANGQYVYEGVTKNFTCKKLENGMKLFICAPTAEIFVDTSHLIRKLAVVTVISLLLFLLLAYYLFGRVIRLANVDPLTGLPNRKYFIEGYQDYVKDANKDYSLFLLDIDYFKHINDRYGHNCGDCALGDLAKAARQYLGAKALLARWGGDEFIGILPAGEISTLLEELRHHQEICEDRGYGKMTVSIGVALIKGHKDLTEVTKAADEALYRSKLEGRNRITWAEEALKN